jgi:catechol 2,3-dioxygenase-like lactoylglutathione lyase family enzyme
MVGFGAEDEHFVVELTYNYNVGSYELGNDFKSLTVKSNAAIERANSNPDRWSLVTEEETEKKTVTAPGGYQFQLEKAGADGLEKLSKVSLASSNLERSVAFWSNFLGMEVLEKTEARVVLSYGPDQASLELVLIKQAVEHKTAFGRIAFAVKATELEGLQNSAEENGGRILTPLVRLDTPGKATVSVVILADPDSHEICFVGDENFRKLSQVDPKADELLNAAMASDQSNDWYQTKGRTKDDAAKTE